MAQQGPNVGEIELIRNSISTSFSLLHKDLPFLPVQKDLVQKGIDLGSPITFNGNQLNRFTG